MVYRGISFFVIFSILLQILCLGEGRKFRIISGIRVSIKDFPYQVAIEKTNVHFCGGSIIHKHFVLTAAHCVEEVKYYKPVPKKKLRLRVGSDSTQQGGHIYEISEVYSHPKYNDKAIMDQHDIALLFVKEPFKFNRNVQKINLSKKTPAEGTLGWVTGYGRQEMMRRSDSYNELSLMAVRIPVVSLRSCRLQLKNVADDMICGGHKKGNRDACVGDSGGPYAVGKTQIGIVAWGIGCGREGVPGVYTNVAFYYKWIKAVVSTRLFRYHEENWNSTILRSCGK